MLEHFKAPSFGGWLNAPCMKFSVTNHEKGGTPLLYCNSFELDVHHLATSNTGPPGSSKHRPEGLASAGVGFTPGPDRLNTNMLKYLESPKHLGKWIPVPVFFMGSCPMF